jgi:hypothetical protein
LDQWELALLIGAAVVAAVSISDYRALLWIALGVADFALTTTYARHALPWMPAAFVTGVMDAAVAFLIITYAQRRWERALGYVFEFMVLVSFTSLTGILHDHFVYVISLELANWAALLVILSGSVARQANGLLARSDSFTRFARNLHWFGDMALSRRTDAPFWSPASVRRRR